MSEFIPLTLQDVTITVEPLYEDERPGDACDCDEEERRAYETAIDDMVSKYGMWGWCCVKVTVRWRGFSSADYLGCCSYEDEEDFKADVYYDDMVQNAFYDLNKEVKDMWVLMQEERTCPSKT